MSVNRPARPTSPSSSVSTHLLALICFGWLKALLSASFFFDLCSNSVVGRLTFCKSVVLTSTRPVLSAPKNWRWRTTFSRLCVCSSDLAPSYVSSWLAWPRSFSWLLTSSLVPDCSRLPTKASSQGFDSLVLLGSWQLWKEWNSRVFNYSLSSVSVMLESILHKDRMRSSAGAIAFWGLSGV